MYPSPKAEGALEITAAVGQDVSDTIFTALTLVALISRSAAEVSGATPRVYSTAEANALPGPNRGVIYVRENLGQPRSPAQVTARVFEDATPGWFVDPASGDKAVPALRYDNPNPGNNFARLDGLTSPTDLIDAKTRLLTFDSKGTTVVPQANDLRRLSEAIRQNRGYTVTIEFSDAAAETAARGILRQLGIRNIITKVRT